MSSFSLSRFVRIAALSTALAVPALAGVGVQAQAATVPQPVVNFWAVPGQFALPEAVMNVNPVIAQAWGLRNPVEPMATMASNGGATR